MQAAEQDEVADQGNAGEPNVLGSDDDDDDHAEEEEADHDVKRNSQLRRLRDLNEQLLRAHQASAVHLLPQEQLLLLLKILGSLMRQGRGRVVHPDEEVVVRLIHWLFCKE
jgi:hypothetical protein